MIVPYLSNVSIRKIPSSLTQRIDFFRVNKNKRLITATWRWNSSSPSSKPANFEKNDVDDVKKRKNTQKSVALSVYFKHPDFNMQKHEILSRATAFLLSVDPRIENRSESDPFSHLEEAEIDREVKDIQRKYNFSPAAGRGKVSDMNWLEFVPKEHRPNVHVVCSSHVISPFLWKDYYPQDWLSKIRQEHCIYYLEILDSTKPQEEMILGKFGLHNSPIHHPEGRDISLMHLEDEPAALDTMKGLGVDILYLRDLNKIYQKNEKVSFEGFEVVEPDTADQASYNREKKEVAEKEKKEKEGNDREIVGVDEDSRMFLPFVENGELAYHTNDRFFALTSRPLPEGLCGAPVLDTDDECCGVVEGIVPLDHENKTIAGSAAFLPSFVLKFFIDYAERIMIKEMMPQDLYQDIVKAKQTNSIGGGSTKVKDEDVDSNSTTTPEENYSNFDELLDAKKKELKQKYSKEEYDAIVWNMERERDEVLKLMDKEGGDMDEIIERVRAQTLMTRDAVVEEYQKGNFRPPLSPKTSNNDDDLHVVDDRDIKNTGEDSNTR